MVQKRNQKLSSSSTSNSSSKPDSESTGDNSPSRISLQRHLRKTKYCVYHLKGICQFEQNCAFAHNPMELQGAPDLRKTRLCKSFYTGGCKDSKCTYAHGEQELRSTDMFYKRTLCSWFGKGCCRNGSRCHFAHGLADLRMYREGSSSSQSEGSVSVQDARSSSDGTSDWKSQGRRHNQLQTGYGGDIPVQVDGSAGRHRQVQWAGADKARPNSLLFEDPMFVQMSSCAPSAPERPKEVQVSTGAVPQAYATPTAAPQVNIQLLSHAVGVLSSQIKVLEAQMRNEQQPCSAATEGVSMWGHLDALAAMSANSTRPPMVGEYYPLVMRKSATSMRETYA